METGSGGGRLTRRLLSGRLRVLLKGKRAAILGPTASGKTSLYNFLEFGSLDGRGAEQTVTPTHRGYVDNPQYGILWKNGTDVPGLADMRGSWEPVFKRADIVFYVFDAHQMRTDAPYRERVSSDGLAMYEWGAKRKRAIVLGTHRDVDPLAREISDAQYRKVIADLDAVEALRSRLTGGRSGRLADFSLGELADDAGARELLTQILP